MSTIEIDTITPAEQNKRYVLGNSEDALVLVQQPLSFFGKMEFFAVMGSAIEKALEETSLFELLDVPDTGGAPLSADAFREADSFIKAISTLVQYAPELLEDLYCVVLAVPRGEREYVKIRLREELTDDQGFEILETFIDQNWDVLVSFFKDKIMPFAGKVGAKFRESVPSTPSKPTPQNTRKRSKNS